MSFYGINGEAEEATEKDREGIAPVDRNPRELIALRAMASRRQPLAQDWAPEQKLQVSLKSSQLMEAKVAKVQSPKVQVI